jgi:hypothetical protein
VTYVELVAEIQNYTQNYETTFVDTIPTFVTQAEERIYNTVQIPPLRKNVTGGVTAGNKYLSCPADYLSTFSLAVINTDGNYEYLLNKDVNFIREAYPNPNDQGLPKYYALFGPTVISSVTTNELSFILGPTPDDDYDVELHYYYYPQSITTAGTSWLGDNYSPALLYGSLLEAYVYMKGEADVMTFYKAKYDEAMMQLNRLGTGLERGDSYRDGQAKIKVNP